MDSLFLLDAYALIYRSYFAFLAKPLRNPKGQNVSAAFGFFRSVFQLWDQYQPKAMAAVFDSRTPTFRHTMYEQYKATRQKTPEDLYDQIPLVEEILKLLGVPLLRADGYEADDLIAALADRCKSENRPCYIVSGDKDLLQLVGGSVLALRPDKDTGWKCIGPSEVQEEWGVSPERILDYLSLTGDHSDNVPGVPGVGDKTAAKLMAQYGSFDAIWENIDTIKPDGVRAKLLAGKDSAFLSRKLITLDMDAPTGVQNLDALSVHSLNKDAASAVFMREGMRSLASRRVADGLDKLDSVAEHRSAAPMHSPVRGIVENSPPPGELFALPQTQKIPEHYSRAGNCELVRDAASLSRWVKNAKKAGTFAFDCETDSLDEMRELPVGFSLAVDDKGGCYVPLKAPEAGLINEDEARNILAPLLADKTLTVVGQNLKFDMHIMENWGCPIACTPWDTMIAAWLLDPERDSLKLEALGQSYLGFGGSPYAELGPKGTPFSSFELAKAAPYASEDAYLCMRLKALMEPLLADTGLLALFTDLEMPVLKVLASMERNGIMVDAAQLFAFGSELDKELAQVQEETYKLVGHEFNLNSPKQLQEVLFVERKLASGKKTKTGYSTDISVLEELAREDPVPQLILRHRTMQKLKSTYVDALVELANKDPRIHTHFVQTGAATGRLSSRDPNLQNIPVREEEGRRIRAAFVAQKGYTLISADYSQIELVVFAHLSDDPELKKAFVEGSDIHRRTAALILGKAESEVSQSERRAAKTINFGVIYGMGAFRLAAELGIPRAEAQRFIDAYFSRYAGVARFIRETVDGAKTVGYVSTILGRRRPIRAINSRNANERQGAERAAVNSPIQGSAADIMKLAMLAADKLITKKYPDARLLLQVHDELIIEVPKEQAPQLAQELEVAMAGAYKLSIPLRVGVETADSWGAMH